MRSEPKTSIPNIEAKLVILREAEINIRFQA